VGLVHHDEIPSSKDPGLGLGWELELEVRS
jgi:hypothetical protein